VPAQGRAAGIAKARSLDQMAIEHARGGNFTRLDGHGSREPQVLATEDSIAGQINAWATMTLWPLNVADGEP
jgi:hypothetical protein